MYVSFLHKYICFLQYTLFTLNLFLLDNVENVSENVLNFDNLVHCLCSSIPQIPFATPCNFFANEVATIGSLWPLSLRDSLIRGPITLLREQGRTIYFSLIYLKSNYLNYWFSTKVSNRNFVVRNCVKVRGNAWNSAELKSIWVKSLVATH